MKPNNFPLITPVANTELYTQTNDVNGKFTMNSAKEFINGSEDVTYTQLYNKIINSELIPGSWYRLTDYTSVNFLNGWNIANNNPTPVVPSFNPRAIAVGDSSEVLLLQAITESEISPIGYSEDFPQDIVTYLPLVNKIGVNLSIQNGNTLPNSDTVSGFDLQWDGTNVYFNMPTGYPALYGHYFSLSAEFNSGSNSINGTYEPLNLNGICQYPNNAAIMPRIKLENGGTKVVLLDLTEQDYLDYDANTLYVETVYALGDAYGWITRRQDTQNRIDVPFDFRWVRYRRYECEVLGNITSISYTSTGNTAADNTYNNINPNSSTSIDGQNATFNVTVIGGSVTSVTIKNAGRLYKVSETFTIDGSQIGGVSGDDDIIITIDGINSNIGYWGIGDVFNGANTTGSNNYIDVLSLNWKEYSVYNLEIDGQGGPDIGYYNGFCENNVFLGTVYDCKIGSYFNTNTIENNFYSNTIGNISQSNTIGNHFGNNTIGNDFNNNTIGNSFQYNTIGDSFDQNTIGDTFGINTIWNSFSNNTIGNSSHSNIIGNEFQSNTIGDGFQNNTIGNSSNNNTIGSDLNYNTIGNGFGNNTIGNGFGNNNIGNGFNTNTIGYGFNNNTIGIDFANNFIGNGFDHNNIGNGFDHNNIGNGFNTNTIGYGFNFNTIGKGFDGNTIGNGFANNVIGDDFVGNTIGNNFINNTIGDSFIINTIGNTFQSNTIINNFQENTTKYSVSSTDFSLATHVYGTYNCEIFQRSDNTLQLSYIDGTNTIQYAAITA